MPAFHQSIGKSFQKENLQRKYILKCSYSTNSDMACYTEQVGESENVTYWGQHSFPDGRFKIFVLFVSQDIPFSWESYLACTLMSQPSWVFTAIHPSPPQCPWVPFPQSIILPSQFSNIYINVQPYKLQRQPNLTFISHQKQAAHIKCFLIF